MKKLIAQKEKQYGPALDNFSCISDLEETFNNYYNENLNDAKDSQTTFMTQQSLHGINRKIARVATGKNSIEHWKDIAGYAQIMINYLEK